jgi:hypothetical protein
MEEVVQKWEVKLEKNLLCSLAMHSKNQYPFSCVSYHTSLWQRQYSAHWKYSVNQPASAGIGREKQGICRQRRDIAKGLGYQRLVEADVHP